MVATTGLVFSRTFENARLSHFKQLPRSRLDPHLHNGLTLFVALSGNYTELSSSSLVRFTDRAMVIKPVDCVHTDLVGPDGLDGLLIEVERDRSHPAWFDRPIDISDDELRSKALSVWAACLDDCAASHANRMVDELIFLTNDRLWRTQPPSWLVDAERFIRDNPAKRLGVDQLARTAGVSRSSLRRGFSRCYREKVGEHIWSLRLMFAMTLLEDTELPIAAVAAEAGFYDQSHLCRWFAQTVHTTPLRYRLSKQRLQTKLISIQSPELAFKPVLCEECLRLV